MFYQCFVKHLYHDLKKMKDQNFKHSLQMSFIFKSSLPEIIHSIKEVDKVNQLLLIMKHYRDDIIWIQI